MNIFGIGKDSNNLDVFEQNVDFKEHMMRILSLLYYANKKEGNSKVCSELKELEDWSKDFLNKYDIINHDWLLKNINVDYRFSTSTAGTGISIDHYTASVSQEVCVYNNHKLCGDLSTDTIKSIIQGVVINKFANSLINPQLYADKEYTITSISLPSTKDSDAAVETKTIVQSEEFAKMLKLLNNYGINTYDKLKEVLDSKIKEIEE